jgi:biopolymer transport protein ExbB
MNEMARRSLTHRGCRIVAALSLISVLALVEAATQAYAQSDGTGDATSVRALPPQETIFTLMVKGGWIMIPIGICSMIVATVSVERTITLRKPRVATENLLDEVFTTIPTRAMASEENTNEALKLCSDSTRIIDRVVHVGVEKLHREEARAQEFLEEAAAKEAHLLRRKLRPLGIVGTLAPLLGLLGTVYGMIKCFENAVTADSASRTATLASGIYEALVSTAAGMTVAIPAMVLHFYFQGRVDRITDTIDETATEFIDHYYGSSARESFKPSSRTARKDSTKPAEIRR